MISRFASALDGMGRDFLDDPVYQEIVRRDLEDGQHCDRLPDGTRARRSYFTTAYLHRPEEIGAELAEAGFEHADDAGDRALPGCSRISMRSGPTPSDALRCSN
jgi:hypothetical protein